MMIVKTLMWRYGYTHTNRRVGLVLVKLQHARAYECVLFFQRLSPPEAIHSIFCFLFGAILPVCCLRGRFILVCVSALTTHISHILYKTVSQKTHIRFCCVVLLNQCLPLLQHFIASVLRTEWRVTTGGRRRGECAKQQNTTTQQEKETLLNRFNRLVEINLSKTQTHTHTIPIAKWETHRRRRKNNNVRHYLCVLDTHTCKLNVERTF